MTADEKIDAFEVLLNEMSGAIADAVGLMQAGHATSDELRQTLVDISEAIQRGPARPEAPALSLDGLIEAIRALRLEVTTSPASHTIAVEPTPVEVHNHLPAPVVQVLPASACEFVITHQYNQRGQAEQSIVKRLTTPGPQKS